MKRQNDVGHDLVTAPGRCARLLVWGAAITLVGCVVLAFGIRTYVDDTISHVEQSITGIVLGGVIAVPGLVVLLMGIQRAGTALDHLVQRSG